MPLRSGLVIVSSANIHYIPNEDVIAWSLRLFCDRRMNLDRLGGSTFDFMVKTNKKKHYDVAL